MTKAKNERFSTLRQRASLVCLCLLLLVGCNTSLLEKAKRMIPIGASRDEAIRALSGEAWYHQSCTAKDTIDDLFFYGSHGYDEADIVIVVSTTQDGSYRVVQIGSFEPNSWHAAYRDCVDQEKFRK